MANMKEQKPCAHPGAYHLASDKLTIVRPHPDAKSEFAREQGYVIAKVEPAYRDLAPSLVRAFNALDDGRKRTQEVAKKLFDVFDASDKIDTKTDAEVADLLMDHVWADVSMLSAKSAILEAAIERLKRAEGGAFDREGIPPLRAELTTSEANAIIKKEGPIAVTGFARPKKGGA